MRNLVNFALFQIGWFACVLGAAHDAVAVGMCAALVICAVHVGAVARDRGREVHLLAVVTAAGSALTAFNVANGAVTFGESPARLALGGVPAWIPCLWALFATLLRHSLAWLQGRPLLAALLALVGSPLSYAGAARLGAVEIHAAFARGPLVLGVSWAAAVPAALWLAARRNGAGTTEGVDA